MTTPKQQYDDMLDRLDSHTKEQLLSHIPFGKVLEQLDPISYRCGLADYQANCDRCHREFYPDDSDAEALCPSCADDDEES